MLLTVTGKLSQVHWNWYDWIQLLRNCNHTWFEGSHLNSVWQRNRYLVLNALPTTQVSSV